MRLRPRLVECSAPLVTFTAAPDAPVTANPNDRTVSGLVVPWNVPGSTAAGLLTFGPGDLSWAGDVRRVKLLRNHDQDRPVGHALDLRETPAGLAGTFRVPPGPDGDAFLAEVAEGLRDGLSVGVQLDAATEARIRRAQAGQAVRGRGVVREVSGVTVPAFDDSRMALATATGGTALTTFTTAPATPTPAADPSPPSATGAAGAPAATPSGAPAQLAQATGGGAVVGGQAPTTGAPAPAPTPAPPGVVRAAAGAVTVTAEPSTYRFNGQGESLVRDAYLARMDGDPEAAARLRRFNAELRGGNPGSVAALATAASPGLATFAPGDPIASPATTADVDIPGVFFPNANRADLLLRAVDAGRPLASRLNRIPITNAQPFLVPIEGEFDGVDDHVEGTPHVAEGTLTLNDAPVAPKAVSGAYRVTRELVDSTNPAIDAIALRAMLRDYRRLSEAKIVAALIAADPVPTYAVNTAMELRAALVAAVNDDDEPMDFAAGSRELIAALYSEVDADGRPMIAAGNAPTVTSGRAGYLGVNVDGTDLIRASRLPAGSGFLVRAAGVLFVESAVQQFRFDEIEGPGIIKLALWAYVGAAVLRDEDVVQVAVGAAP